MSIFRRPTRAAGDTWSKWEDPIVYAAPVQARLTHLLLWIEFGTCSGFIAIAALAAIRGTASPAEVVFAEAFFVAFVCVVLWGLVVSWDTMTENER